MAPPIANGHSSQSHAAGSMPAPVPQEAGTRAVQPPEDARSAESAPHEELASTSMSLGLPAREGLTTTHADSLAGLGHPYQDKHEVRPGSGQQGAEVEARPRLGEEGAEAVARPGSGELGAEAEARPDSGQQGAEAEARPGSSEQVMEVQACDDEEAGWTEADGLDDTLLTHVAAGSATAADGNGSAVAESADDGLIADGDSTAVADDRGGAVAEPAVDGGIAVAMAANGNGTVLAEAPMDNGSREQVVASGHGMEAASPALDGAASYNVGSATPGVKEQPVRWGESRDAPTSAAAAALALPGDDGATERPSQVVDIDAGPAAEAGLSLKEENANGASHAEKDLRGMAERPPSINANRPGDLDGPEVDGQGSGPASPHAESTASTSHRALPGDGNRDLDTAHTGGAS